MLSFKDFTSKEQVLEIINKTSSIKEFITYIGRKINGGSWYLIKQLSSKFNINFNKLYYNSITEEEYLLKPNHCLNCQKELTFKQRNNKFCCSSCAASFNNKKRAKIKNIKEKRKKQSIIKKNFDKEEKYKQLVQLFEEGNNFIKGSSQVPTFIRRYLFQKYNNCCQICGWGEENPYNHKIPLAIHHIDGDCTNNRISNLELLCPNCHSLTNNFGSLNKNSKRFHRKKFTIEELKEENKTI